MLLSALLLSTVAGSDLASLLSSGLSKLLSRGRHLWAFPLEMARATTPKTRTHWEPGSGHSTAPIPYEGDLGLQRQLAAGSCHILPSGSSLAATSSASPPPAPPPSRPSLFTARRRNYQPVHQHHIPLRLPTSTLNDRPA